jgi:DNA-directed RNA polymerase specialized sigma24 family protein
MKKFGQKSFKRFKRGDMQDFELLYLTHYSFVKLYTVCIPDSDPQKEVIIDDVFFQARETREIFKDLPHVQKYLRVMTLRASNSYCRNSLAGKDLRKEKNPLSGPAEDGAAPKEEDLGNLYMHLTDVPFINRLIIRLAFAEKKSNVEIARILHVSTNNIGIRKCRALKSLKSQMGRPGWG